MNRNNRELKQVRKWHIFRRFDMSLSTCRVHYPMPNTKRSARRSRKARLSNWRMVGILSMLLLLVGLSSAIWNVPATLAAAASFAGHVAELDVESTATPLPDVTVVAARPVFTPTTEFGGMPVVYAGAGDGSWPDQMEPNDGMDDVLGPAPVEVGILYRSLNLLPRVRPAANPTPGEDRDWYVWNSAKGRCYRAFTGDISGSHTQLTGKGRIQHAIRIWWFTPVKEGRKLLAEYNPGMGAAEGGYFAAATACGEIDGQMAAEVFNYNYPLKNPAGATYTFGVLDVGQPQVASTLPPVASNSAGVPAAPSGNPGKGTGTAHESSTPTSQIASPTSVATETPTQTPSPVIRAPATNSAPAPSPTASFTPSSTPTLTALPASVDVVAYIDRNQNGAPDPGEGLSQLQVTLLSVRTNSVQQTVETNVDGYARLDWTWAGRVRVALPDINWSDMVDPYDMASASSPHSDVWSISEEGSLYLEVRVLPAPLPAVIP